MFRIGGNSDTFSKKKHTMSTRFAQIVMGPAGSGKSTYVQRMSEYYQSIKRVVHCVNLDPAADEILYEPVIDIREAITVPEIMKKYDYGPNGALIYCMEQVVIDFEWFDSQIGEHEYDYLIIDFPGQIELFSHLDVLPRIIKMLKEKGYFLTAVFLIDSQFMLDPSKFLSGGLVALSAMTMLEIPHLNLISKCDLLSNDQKERIELFTEMDTLSIGSSIKKGTKLDKLTQKICELIDNFNLLHFYPFSIKDNDIVSGIATQIDILLQYADNADNDDPEFFNSDMEDEGPDPMPDA
jgi:GTPase SAR1 family protein